MLRVARLHVSFLQLLEECPLAACIRRPSIDQSSVEPLGLSAQEADIMHMRRIEGADQQNTVVETLDCLMELDGGIRSEERRVGKESVRTCSSGWSQTL